MNLKQALKERRYARFYVTREAVYDGDPDALAEFLSKTITLRCEFMAAYSAFEYEACSPLFEPLLEGQEMPRLKIVAVPLGVSNLVSLEFQEA